MLGIVWIIMLNEPQQPLTFLIHLYSIRQQSFWGKYLFPNSQVKRFSRVYLVSERNIKYTTDSFLGKFGWRLSQIEFEFLPYTTIERNLTSSYYLKTVNQ